ncbi:hypothetical protein [Erythrobacter aurantius]|uniref:hypothetical protein n=1 Tax=Erythrobacter aurantius TaxID=2909249 RepID=UPI00207A1235|nr:hypothetical protein [Erythrobacter aurantius]
MRNQMFECEISRPDRLVTCFVVASDAQRASEIVLQNEIEINRETLNVRIERIDESLPASKRTGLDTLLTCGVIGLASYNDALGWLTHAVPAPKLHFYRIKEVDGDSYYIIAPTGDVAAEVYGKIGNFKNGDARLFRILDGFYGLKPDKMRGLLPLLEFGPIGQINWADERGWHLA